MTEEDKKLIADYMEWKMDMDDWWRSGDYGLIKVTFDLNDAELCVKEMQKRRDLDDFKNNASLMCFKVTKIDIWPTNLFAWLYDADNFFAAMATWLKEEKK